ncbi:MAG: DivIVA domain protein [Frankiales bacterium]|nr:DivIVA domain protein [Frankiales bacterium]
MLTALAILGVLAVLFLVFALATSDRQALAPAPPDAADVALPDDTVRADDVRGLRFGLALRGYRMSEVDAALGRLAAELEARDTQLAALQPVDKRDAPVSSDEPGGPEQARLADGDPQGVVVAPELVVPPPVDPVAAGEAGASAVDPGGTGAVDLVEGPDAPDPDLGLPTGPPADPSVPEDPAGETVAAPPVPDPAPADSAFGVAADLPVTAPTAAAEVPGTAPALEVGEAPVEPVDPPVRP